MTNITNNITGTNVDLHTAINGISPIKRIAASINELQDAAYWESRHKAGQEAVDAWHETPDFKILNDLRIEQHKLYEDESRNFWGKRKNQARIDETEAQVREVYLRNTKDTYQVHDTARGAINSLEYELRGRVISTLPRVLSENTIHGILLTIPALENKSFDDILKIVNKYVSK